MPRGRVVVAGAEQPWAARISCDRKTVAVCADAHTYVLIEYVAVNRGAGIFFTPQGQVHLFGGAETSSMITTTSEWYYF